MVNRFAEQDESLLSRLLAAVRSLRMGGQEGIALRYRYPDERSRPGATFKAQQISSTNNVAKLLNQNGRRYGFLVRADQASTVRIWPSPDVAANRGIKPADTDYTSFTRRDWGDLVGADWYQIGAVGAQFIEVIEVF